MRIPERAVPPGDQLIRKESKEIDAHNTTHIGPQEGLKKIEFELYNGHGEGHGKLDRAEEYG